MVDGSQSQKFEILILLVNKIFCFKKVEWIFIIKDRERINRDDVYIIYLFFLSGIYC